MPSARAPLAALLAALAVAACGVGPPASGEIDAGPDAPITDAPDGGGGEDGGLHLRFVAAPRPPAEVGGDYECALLRVDLRLEDVRVVGDAAPGDDRTRVDALDVDWGDDDGDSASDGDDVDPEVWFDEAPPGMYSYVLATISEYDIRGTAVLEDGGVTPFRIDDDQAGLTLSIPLPDLMLEAGATVDIEVTVALDDLVRDLAWDEVDLDEGTLEVEDDDPQIEAVRSALRAAFVGPSGGAGVDGESGSGGSGGDPP